MKNIKKWKRTLLFWGLACLFLITTPILVLNARGYRFDVQRGVFVYSGTITFKSNPQTVNVKLNDELIESKKLNMINNSYNLSGLLPRSYDFEVSAEGFQAWKKRMNVHSGLASEFWNVLLVRNEYEKTPIETPDIEKFFLASGGNLIAYTTNPKEAFGVKVYDVDDKEMQAEFDLSDWQFVEKERKENIEWSPDGKIISIPVQKEAPSSNEKSKLPAQSETIANYFIADTEKKTVFNLNEFLNLEDISNVRWDSQKKGYLFFLSENELYRANIINNLDITKIASNVSGFDISRGNVYYSTLTNNLIFRYNSNGTLDQITSTFPVSEGATIYTMTVYDEKRIALILKNKDLYIFNQGEHDTHFRKLESGVREAHFSDDGKKMLYWNDFEIGVYYLRDEMSQPARNENEKFDITRYSEPLANVQWFNNYEHIIFSTGRWTKIIELDPRDQRNCMDIMNTEIESPSVVYSSRLKKLFFTDLKNESTSLFSINFPEETSIFGALGFGQ
jgi:hypothetical protein